jgi:FtsZ-binding cell division protein ZapB
MNKKITLSIVLIVIISLTLATWLVNYQISDVQSQISEVKIENSELQNQTSDLQHQLSDLQLENREQQDRLTDFTYQLAVRSHLSVKITAFKWIGGFNPIVGLTLVHSVNVTVQNNDVVPLSGLILAVRLANKATGAEIGDGDITLIDRLNAGESREIIGRAYTTISTALNDVVVVTTLKVGNIVLDEWTHALTTSESQLLLEP